MSEGNKDTRFDQLMELVGNDGKFQLFYNLIFNVALVAFGSMCFMNIVLVLNEPDHVCHVPGSDKYNLTINVWHNLTIPNEQDNRGTFSRSGCKMYNTSLVEHLPIDEWQFTEHDVIPCIHGYDYDKTWYARTVVSDQDWICDKALYQTNLFLWHRAGVVVGNFFFGQLGDVIGRRPVFYLSAVILIAGRVMSSLTASIYFLYAIASFISMMTTRLIITSPMIIAIEISKEADRSRIAILQCIGWSLGMTVMPLVFWAVGDWVWFLILTTLPIGLFTLWSKFIIESPRWLATKGYFGRCAEQLNRIAKINGKDVVITEKIVSELLSNEESGGNVFGMLSLFVHWRLAKNSIMVFLCWSIALMTYLVLTLMSARMGGNPFLSFLYLRAIELPAFFIGRYLVDNIGRRYSNAMSMFCIFLACIPAALTAQDPNLENLMKCLVIFIQFSTSLVLFTVSLLSMEIFPTCLRQSGMAIGCVVANMLAIFGPYIVYLGTAFDIRYPFLVLGALGLIGFFSAMFLPETLNRKLPNTLNEAKKFGKDQKFWSWPRKQIESTEEDMEVLRKINGNGKTHDDIAY